MPAWMTGRRWWLGGTAALSAPGLSSSCSRLGVLVSLGAPCLLASRGICL